MTCSVTSVPEPASRCSENPLTSFQQASPRPVRGDRTPLVRRAHIELFAASTWVPASLWVPLIVNALVPQVGSLVVTSSTLSGSPPDTRRRVRLWMNIIRPVPGSSFCNKAAGSVTSPAGVSTRERLAEDSLNNAAAQNDYRGHRFAGGFAGAMQEAGRARAPHRRHARAAAYLGRRFFPRHPAHRCRRDSRRPWTEPRLESGAQSARAAAAPDPFTTRSRCDPLKAPRHLRCGGRLPTPPGHAVETLPILRPALGARRFRRRPAVL